MSGGEDTTTGTTRGQDTAAGTTRGKDTAAGTTRGKDTAAGTTRGDFFAGGGPPRAVVTDFGGVLTTPLIEAFTRANAEIGIPAEALRDAMRLSASRAHEPPLFTLERGQMTEDEFTRDLGESLGQVLGRPVDLDGYGARLMRSLDRNEPLIAYYRDLRARGVRLAILTNNVREWQPLWRSRLAADDLFELIVDSAFEGLRKPEPEIYSLTLERLGLPGDACAFVDDLEVNLPPARDAGMHAIHYRDAGQAIAELDALFARPHRSPV